VRQQIDLTVRYGLLDNTAVNLFIPYVSIDVSDIGLTEAGLGDIALGAAQRITSGAVETWLSAGVSLPTGKSDAEDDVGSQAHASLQPGRGAADFLFGIKGLGVLSRSWTLYGDIMSRWPLAENDSGYRHGTVVDAAAGGLVTVGRLDIFAHLLWEHAESDEEDGRETADTGGDIVYVTPGIRLRLTDFAVITLKDQALVSHSANGEQMVPRHTFGLGFTLLLGP
jgi:hypothetical protein